MKRTNLILLSALVLLPVMVGAQDDFPLNPSSITWEPSSDPYTIEYRIYEATESGAQVKGLYWNSVDAPATEYSLLGHPDGDYYYKISAVNVFGLEGELGDECKARFVTPAPPPPPPGGCSMVGGQ